MRRYGWVLTPLLLAAAPPAAQPVKTPPVAPPAAAPADAPPGADPLDDYLTRWQQVMQDVQSLSAKLERTEKDTVADVERKCAGYTEYLKVGTGANTLNLALLEMTPKGKTEFSERFVCTGSYLYQFLPAQKEIQAHPLPQPKAGQVADDNFLAFLFGMKKEEARKRYDLKLTKTDQYYLYVEITPKFAADKEDFRRAQIVLNKETMFPRRLWFEQSSGSETTWDILKVDSGAKLDRRDFDAPTPPQGWKLTTVPHNAEAPPRVVRTKDGN